VRSLLRDLLEACRGLRRERIVASTVVVTLGAAIGASVVAFVALFVLLAGVLASWFPARRAAATDPSEALRPTSIV
jgi:ABC-type lipoprotein release transport system permease subunit